MADLRETLEQEISGSYTIERELGGGGMSRVFVANERLLDRRVVIKVLPEDVAAGISADRFRREIQVAAKLQHAHIVPVLTAGEVLGRPYFTMPFIEGESLRARLDRTGDLPLSEAVRILREIASAIAYAHLHGIVHRDIKPDNVLISDEFALVTDFGVAKALKESVVANSAGTATAAGVAIGTPEYMSPEQVSGDPHLDHRSDIYSFGILAYESQAVVELSVKIVYQRGGRIAAGTVLKSTVAASGTAGDTATLALDQAFSEVLVQMVKWTSRRIRCASRGRRRAVRPTASRGRPASCAGSATG